jgi:hypothetical protein
MTNNMNYRKLYDKLVTSRKSLNRKKNLEVYYEAHHIKPKCFGGDGDCRNIKHPNIVLLTPKEHYIAHLLLVAIYPESPAMKKALWNMCITGKKERYKPFARTFEKIRLAYIASVQDSGGTFYGKKHTIESLVKIGAASKGRKANLGNRYSEETRKKLSEIAKQRKLSNQTRKKISKATCGGNHYKAIPIVCEKTGQIFGSGKELSEYTGIPSSTIRRWLNGTTPAPYTFHYKRQNLAYDQ